MPADRQACTCSGSAFAVSARIGTRPPCARASAARMARAAAGPSRTGMTMSISTASNTAPASAATASAPSAASVTSAPIRASRWRITSRFVALSSATRMRAPRSFSQARASSAGQPPPDRSGWARRSRRRSSGRVTVNRVPCPGALSTRTSPPIRRHSCRVMTSPSPVPPKRREMLASACRKGWNSASSRSGAIPMPVSATVRVSSAGM